MNDLVNPFKFGFFTKKVGDYYYILYFKPFLPMGIMASFSMQNKIPDYIDPNIDMPKIDDFKYNEETGTFTSNIGNGKFIKDENDNFKAIFDIFYREDISTIELDFSIKLNHNMGKNPYEGMKI